MIDHTSEASPLVRAIRDTHAFELMAIARKQPPSIVDYWQRKRGEMMQRLVPHVSEARFAHLVTHARREAPAFASLLLRKHYDMG